MNASSDLTTQAWQDDDDVRTIPAGATGDLDWSFEARGPEMEWAQVGSGWAEMR